MYMYSVRNEGGGGQPPPQAAQTPGICAFQGDPQGGSLKDLPNIKMLSMNCSSS